MQILLYYHTTKWYAEFNNNTVMRKELEGLGADVTWFQGPGAHSWQFWDQEIKKAVPWMLNAEKQEVDDETQRV